MALQTIVPLPVPALNMFFADDAVQLISPKMFKSFLLPVYRKLEAGVVTTAKRVKVHLCSDATRHNLAPDTPFANLEAMYSEARQFRWAD